MDDGPHVDRMLQDFYARANAVISRFRCLAPNVLLYLFNTYATCYFGLVTCDLSRGVPRRIFTGWNKCIRRIFSLPPTTHTRLLSPIIGQPNVSQIIHGRFIKFAHQIISSDNCLVFNIANLCYNRQTSRFGKNLAFVLLFYGVTDVNSFASYRPRDLRTLLRRVQAIRTDFRAHFISDLLLAVQSGHEDRDLLADILQYLCCH
jgi:hypothetical protein